MHEDRAVVGHQVADGHDDVDQVDDTSSIDGDRWSGQRRGLGRKGSAVAGGRRSGQAQPSRADSRYDLADGP